MSNGFFRHDVESLLYLPLVDILNINTPLQK